ncbi:MAG: LytTR family DNA-binding domain-containing protein [Chitinophagaceae bacterium]|jgi:DNA-binding LytR/AlgR family response regulator|nr:LytTR family DNA-binding domain-containing protein [Chitinophagaceae bacterium]
MENKINCIVVDDERPARVLIESYISKLPYINLISSCADAMEAIEILQTNRVDLIISDIQMPQITGIEFIKSLNIPPPFIIFITAHKDFAIESYDLNAVDYLLKPVSFDRFLKAIMKVREFSNKRLPHNESAIHSLLPYIFLKDGNTLVKVILKEILYIEGSKDFVKVVMKNKNIVPYIKMMAIEEMLPPDLFLRIHKSYILNISAIATITGNLVRIINGDEIPVAKQYRQILNEKIGYKK